MSYIELKNILNETRAEYSSCTKIFCTTCGGLSYSLKKKMTAKLKSDLDIALSQVSMQQFLALGE